MRSWPRRLLSNWSSVDSISCRFHPRLRAAITQVFPSISGWNPVQEKTFEALLGPCSVDLLLQSSTGSGKTLAYLLPLIQRVCFDNSEGKPTSALIVAPTRELARQIHAVADKLLGHEGGSSPGQSVLLCGGDVHRVDLTRIFTNTVRLIIGTPGGVISKLPFLSDLPVRFVVLDEVDRLFDSGFANQVEQIFFALHKKGPAFSLVLVSATMPRSVQLVANRILRKNHVVVREEGHVGLVHMPPTLEQRVVQYEPLEFVPSLMRVVGEWVAEKTRERGAEAIDHRDSKDDKCYTESHHSGESKCMVIFPTSRSLLFFYSVVKDLVRLRYDGCVSVVALHGRMGDEKRKNVMVGMTGILGKTTMADMTNTMSENREKVMSDMTANSPLSILPSPLTILCCTDVAARGLDIPCLDLVVHVGLSGSEDAGFSQYVHRSGRTARASRRGKSVLLVGTGIDAESKEVKELVSSLGLCGAFDGSLHGTPGSKREIAPPDVADNLESTISPADLSVLASYSKYQRHLSSKCLESLLSWHIERRSGLVKKSALVKSLIDLVRSSGLPQPWVSAGLAKKLKIDNLPGLILRK